MYGCRHCIDWAGTGRGAVPDDPVQAAEVRGVGARDGAEGGGEVVPRPRRSGGACETGRSVADPRASGDSGPRVGRGRGEYKGAKGSRMRASEPRCTIV